MPGGTVRLPDNSETQILEFKESWRDEYLRTICAFANSTGGKLVIGKDDNGNLVGLKNSKRLLEDIPNKVKEILGILVDVNLHKQAEKEFIEIVVEPYLFPVSYRGEYYCVLAAPVRR
jgi:ATP-dependent DNA helicase RecG